MEGNSYSRGKIALLLISFFILPKGGKYMRFNNVAVLFLVLLLATPAISGAAEPPTGFRNFNWGSSPSASLKKISGPSDGITIYVPASGKALAPLFEVPVAEEAYSFSKGKFYSGSAWFDGHGNFEKVKAALVKAYGQPAFINDKLALWKWKWPGKQIEVDLSYQANFARTTVTFVNNAI